MGHIFQFFFSSPVSSEEQGKGGGSLLAVKLHQHPHTGGQSFHDTLETLTSSAGPDELTVMFPMCIWAYRPLHSEQLRKPRPATCIPRQEYISRDFPCGWVFIHLSNWGNSQETSPEETADLSVCAQTVQDQVRSDTCSSQGTEQWMQVPGQFCSSPISCELMGVVA